jgi:hypothetical protein
MKTRSFIAFFASKVNFSNIQTPKLRRRGRDIDLAHENNLSAAASPAGTAKQFMNQFQIIGTV